MTEPSTVGSFQRFIRRRAIKRVSSGLWTSNDPFDFDGKEPIDYYRAYFTDKAGNPYARIVKADGDALDIRLWNGESFVEDIKADLDSLSHKSLDIRRKYYEIIVKYASVAEFLAKDWWYPFVRGLGERVLQSTYQIKTSIRADRLDVLAAILENRLKDNDYDYMSRNDCMNSEQIMVELFGQRVSRHREYGRIDSRIDLILDSLVESGDIERVGDYSFRPRGKAITTISQAATEDRRHRVTAWLTGALIFVGVLGVNWAGWTSTVEGWIKSFVAYVF